ncbi:hypothetical protein B0T24DRAFT_712121 [Lasiosphaeria ovina]|uniref:Uncharacterized protein n=1 Tax=Lasiosphaeria ovina TaxID=92902 RepID=A0AAE0JVH2_9PEZI|nr:hypothetical protein B0T24DRAFT_712121 [Lasiosphaeria ovina]
MESDKSGDVSEGLRNLIMQHADSRTLLKHYLSHEMVADTRAITQGLEPQRAVMKAMCSLGSSISKRRPTKLTAGQSASVNRDPRIRGLVQGRDALRAASRRSADAVRKYRAAANEVEKQKTAVRRALLVTIREAFDDEQAVDDIERHVLRVVFETGKWGRVWEVIDAIADDDVVALVVGRVVVLDEEGLDGLAYNTFG